jgi:hypothetical protein
MNAFDLTRHMYIRYYLITTHHASVEKSCACTIHSEQLRFTSRIWPCAIASFVSVEGCSMFNVFAGCHVLGHLLYLRVQNHIL